MIFEIHWGMDGNDDHFVIEGETVEEIREQALHELGRRGLDLDKDGVWSIEQDPKT